MIDIYKKTEQGMTRVDALQTGSWIHATDPNPDEVAWLEQHAGVPASFLTSALDLGEQARLDREGEARLIILRVPYFAGDDQDVPYRTVPLGVVLMHHNELIVTVCRIRLSLVDDLLQQRHGAPSTAKRNRLILRILLVNAQKYLGFVREIDNKVDAIEDKLQRSLRNEEVLKLLKYQKSLVFLTTGLKSNDLMMARLQRSQLFEMYPDDQELLDDVIMENAQANEMVQISSNILSQMMDAFASIIANNVNAVMKFLASITVIIALPTLVASIYGMNVKLPMQDVEHAFPVVMALTLLVSCAIAYVFWKRDWF